MNSLYRNFFKPFLDFLIAFVGCIFLFPLFLFISIVLSITNKGKPFFLQVRPGKDERLFRIMKFRTMTEEKDANGNLLPDSLRLTRIGKIIRRTSLDETLQLINVLKGDMSLIGPRPLLPEYLALYSEFQKQRHRVKPGITGWAQVNGRNSVNWEEKFILDVWYVENLTFQLDCKILLKTIKKVLLSEGIAAEGHETMPTFVEYMRQKENIL